MNYDTFTNKFIISLFGTLIDEYNDNYIDVYKFELKQIYEEIQNRLKYIKNFKLSEIEKYHYVLSLLLIESETLLNHAGEIYSFTDLKDLANRIMLNLE